jgi:putative phosphoesterase
VRLLIISDTHVPHRARDLPPSVWAAVDDCDAVVHAGDWVDVALLDALSERAPLVLGVHGNNDHGALRERLPLVARAEFEGVRLGVVHETGPSTGRDARLSAAYPDLDLLVFGHSHIPWDTTTATGLRLLNPGSPTDRRRMPACTFLTAVVAHGAVREVELHEVADR